MDYMPLFVDMSGKSVLVVGAGRIAHRKIETLLKYGAHVEVVTLEVACKEIEELGVKIQRRGFAEEDLDGRFLVAAATDDSEFNSWIVELCEKRNILVNNMTTKTDLNCRFAASLNTSDYQVAVSAKGYPKKAKALLSRIGQVIEEDLV